MASSKVQRKLEKLELDHLRQLATDLHAQLEQAQQSAEMWQQHAEMLQQAMDDEDFTSHRSIGITKSGELLVVKH